MIRLARRFAVLLLAAALVTVPGARPTEGASALDGFDPGMIITDANFYKPSAQTKASLTTFLNSVGAGCVENPIDGTQCLKDYVADTPARAANAQCKALTAVTGDTAAGMISRISTACGINPEVMVVVLQKEQGLITASGLGLDQDMYRHATGAGCPDYTVCDTSLESFFGQVYSTAQRFQAYRQNPYDWSYQPGPVQMAYNPDLACGTASFTIRNQATANLYNYTPYVPNAASLGSLWGSDACSVSDKANFYVRMKQWFPASMPTSTAPAIVPAPASTLSAAMAGVSATADNTGGLGWAMGDLNCTSFTYGPCTRNFLYGKVAWSSAAGGSVTTGAVPTATRARWSGADRYETASAIVANAFPTASMNAVYVASGEVFADALAGGAAANRVKAPLLLVKNGSIPPSTAAQLTRLNPSTIYVLGGTGTVSTAVEQALASYARTSVVRIGGADRYALAVNTSKASWPTGASTVTIALGEIFTDSLSAANLFQRRPGAILLSRSGGLDAATVAEIQRLKPARVFIAGGSGSVPAAVEDQIAQLGIPSFRLAGADRYTTSVRLARVAYPDSAPTVYLALGTVFADGLAAGPASGRLGGPILLTKSDCMPIQTALYLNKVKPSKIVMVSGTGVMSDAVGNLRVCGS